MASLMSTLVPYEVNRVSVKNTVLAERNFILCQTYSNRIDVYNFNMPVKCVLLGSFQLWVISIWIYGKVRQSSKACNKINFISILVGILV